RRTPTPPLFPYTTLFRSHKSKPLAERDLAELKAFASAQGCADLQAWDMTYYSEKLRVEKYAVSQEDLRPYFPAERVIGGMFEVRSEEHTSELQSRENLVC